MRFQGFVSAAGRSGVRTNMTNRKVWAVVVFTPSPVVYLEENGMGKQRDLYLYFFNFFGGGRGVGWGEWGSERTGVKAVGCTAGG